MACTDNPEKQGGRTGKLLKIGLGSHRVKPSSYYCMNLIYTYIVKYCSPLDYQDVALLPVLRAKISLNR